MRGIKKHEIASKTGLEYYVGLFRGWKARSGNEDREGDRKQGHIWRGFLVANREPLKDSNQGADIIPSIWKDPFLSVYRMKSVTAKSSQDNESLS